MQSRILSTSEALPRDVGRGVARIDPVHLDVLGVPIGGVLEIRGNRKAYAKAMPTFPEQRDRDIIQVDGLVRENARCGIGEKVEVRAGDAAPASLVRLESIGRGLGEREEEYVARLLDGLPVQTGDRIRATLFGSHWVDFRIRSTRPSGVVLIHPTTAVRIEAQRESLEQGPGLTYEDIGGLGPQLVRIRELIELPLKCPEVFTKLGIRSPKGVLLHGPPGTGKTLIARALANEAAAAFYAVNGPEIIHKFYGESEAHLRKVFETAAKNTPSIIFLDEIDAIAPKREKVVGDVEKRVVAQLLALLDGLEQRGQIIVIGATNIPDALDPALRRPGRFDREVEVPIPNRKGRRQILEIHSRGMPLDDDVDLAHLADVTHGFVGADLGALCREAAMTCIRTIIPDIDLGAAVVPYQRLESLTVTMRHFLEAMQTIEPSAIREIFTEIPAVGWRDVGGLEAVKEQLVEAVIWPLVHRDIYRRAALTPPKGLLLSGPPGTGKTLIARALAHESGVNFISVKGPELLSRYVGESERAVREVFHKARQAAPCIVFLDEIDAMVPRRAGRAADSGVSERVVSQFLTEIDGIEELRGVFTLAATNRAELVDPALLRPGRIEQTVEIPSPDERALAEIYHIHTRGRPVAEGVDLSPVVARSVGMTGAEVEWVCRRAAQRAVRRAIAAGGNLAGGNLAGGNLAGGNPAGGNLAGGNPAGGNLAGGNPAGGNPAGGNLAGGNLAEDLPSGVEITQQDFECALEVSRPPEPLERKRVKTP